MKHAPRNLTLTILLSGMLLLGSAQAQPTEVELWTFIDPLASNIRSQALAHVIETFEAANPDLRVVPNVVQWQEISPTLLRAGSAGRVPDVTMMFAPLLPTHTSAGTLTALDPYIDQWPAGEVDDLVRFPEVFGRDGTTYALPYEMRVGGVIYRADVFAELGLEVPRSLDQLTEVAIALTEGNRIGMVMPFSPQNASGAMEWLFPTLVGLGAKVLNEDGSAAFVSPEAERLVQWIYDLVNVHQAMPLDAALLGSEETQQLFLSGLAMMRPIPTHRLEFVRTESGLGQNVQIMELVTFDENQPGPALTQGWTLAIPRGAKNPDAAWRFIEHWVSADMQVAQAKMAGYIPIRASVLDDPWFETDVAADIRWALSYAAAHPMTFAGLAENTNVLYDVWARMMERVLTGQMTPAQGLAWAEREYDSLIR